MFKTVLQTTVIDRCPSAFHSHPEQIGKVIATAHRIKPNQNVPEVKIDESWRR